MSVYDQNWCESGNGSDVVQAFATEVEQPFTGDMFLGGDGKLALADKNDVRPEDSCSNVSSQHSRALRDRITRETAEREDHTRTLMETKRKMNEDKRRHNAEKRLDLERMSELKEEDAMLQEEAHNISIASISQDLGKLTDRDGGKLTAREELLDGGWGGK